MIGAELGYRYVDSPLIAAEPGEGARAQFHGVRADHLARSAAAARVARRRHARCRTASATATATRCCGSAARGPMRPACNGRSPRSARRCRCSTLPTNAPRDIYGYDLLLLRPDMHVVWRGNEAPREPAESGGACHGPLNHCRAKNIKLGVIPADAGLDPADREPNPVTSSWCVSDNNAISVAVNTVPACADDTNGLTPPARSSRWSCALRYRRARAARPAARMSWLICDLDLAARHHCEQVIRGREQLGAGDGVVRDARDG